MKLVTGLRPPHAENQLKQALSTTEPLDNYTKKQKRN
jgi:hypothetical protein